MLISRSKKFIFVHISKTAGSSIRKSFLPYTENSLFKLLSYFPKKIGHPINIGPEPLSAHSYAYDIQTFLGEKTFNSYFSFCFVRNPYERAVSQFYFLKNYSKGPDNHKLISRLTTLYDFLLYRDLYGLLIPQFNCISDPQSNIIVDYVGRVESLTQSLTHIFHQLKISAPPKLYKINTSNRPSVMEALDKNSIELINQRYQKDFESFGYDYL